MTEEEQSLIWRERNELAKKLRSRTGECMMECKKALARFDNDYVKALEYLRTTEVSRTGCFVLGRKEKR